MDHRYPHNARITPPAHYRHPGPIYRYPFPAPPVRTVPGAATRVQYPLSYYRPVRMSGRQRVASVVFLVTMVALIAGAIYWFVAYVGFDRMTQMYGFDVVIEQTGVEPPPEF